MLQKSSIIFGVAPLLCFYFFCAFMRFPLFLFFFS